MLQAPCTRAIRARIAVYDEESVRVDGEMGCERLGRGQFESGLWDLCMRDLGSGLGFRV